MRNEYGYNAFVYIHSKILSGNRIYLNNSHVHHPVCVGLTLLLPHKRLGNHGYLNMNIGHPAPDQSNLGDTGRCRTLACSHSQPGQGHTRGPASDTHQCLKQISQRLLKAKHKFIAPSPSLPRVYC